MGRVGNYLVSHLLSTGRYKVYFSPCDSDYMTDRWRKEIRDIILRNPGSKDIDQSIDFCSVHDARRPRSAKCMSTYFYYELNSLPKKIVEDINSNDQVYVCSSFIHKTFLREGVTAPITVLGHGFDPKFYTPTKRLRGKEFTFLCVAEHTPRKNLPILIRCFERAFQNVKDARLVLKLGLHGEGDIRHYITKPAMVSTYRRRTLSETSLADLYKSAHCFVLPTRAEGFGMPILEAMATGMPVIVTNYSGHLDFCTDENSFLIANKGLVDSSMDCFPNIKSQWGDPDPDHLISLMRWVYDNYDRALEVGGKAQEQIHAHWTWKQQLSASFPQSRVLSHGAAAGGL